MPISALDKWLKPCGPCLLCNHPDKRHRVWDVWMDMAGAGDSPERIAIEYDEPLDYVVAVLRLRPYQDS